MNVKWYFTAVQICSSLTISALEHHFMCILNIFIISLVKGLGCLLIFKWDCFLLVNCKSSFYILDIIIITFSDK